MSTQVFLRSEVATGHRGTNTADLSGANVGWAAFTTSTSRGSGLTNFSRGTVAGPTNGLEIRASSPVAAAEWLTPPVDQDVTISGAITGNIWASENNMSANVAINFVVDKLAATDGAITQIVQSARSTEVAVTTDAVNNFTATPGAGVALTKGDRLRIRVFADDAGTMASGFTWNVGFEGTTAGADGDTYVQFTETFGFQTSDPSGTKLYMSATASDVGTASTVDREAWTTAGSSTTTNLVTNTATGFTAPIQMTDSAGGTIAEWFTKPLQAFTLGGLTKLQVRAFESSSTINASIQVEVARVNNDGTGATVWGVADLEAVTTSGSIGEVPVSAAGNRNCWVAGAALSVSDGQRLRFRFFVDDCGETALVTGGTVTLRYDGADATTTWIQLEQSVSEFVAAGKAPPFRRPFPRVLMVR